MTTAAARNYAWVTAAYWAFTLTDGALRMLVLLHFHQLGYSPVQLAFLFLFYELFGITTNLVGGYVAARVGLKVTLTGGLLLQVAALLMLSGVSPSWSKVTSVAFVMAAQSLSGIAKDLTKMSAKSSIKLLVPEGSQSALFKWVALLTGSKNALKGAGFFLGGTLLAAAGFRGALVAMAGALVLVFAGAEHVLPGGMGRTKAKAKFSGLLSKNHEVNVLSAARFFLFGARDIWFVVGVPVYLCETMHWSFQAVGAALALWVVGYGAVQTLAPRVVSLWGRGAAPGGLTAQVLAITLALVTALTAASLQLRLPPIWSVVGGLALFGVVFAVSSSVHSYLILAYSDGDKVALNVGFYYMANAAGRLVGTLLSGLLFEYAGVKGCLWGSVVFAFAAAGCSFGLRPADAQASAGSSLDEPRSTVP